MLLTALILTAALPPPLDCPAGTEQRLWTSPDEVTRTCEKRAANGQVLMHGPMKSWSKGTLRQAGEYRDSRRAGTWTWYRADGTRELIATFGDDDDTRQMINSPDLPSRRVQDFGPDHLTSKINGERVTALGEGPHHAGRYRRAPVRAIVRVVGVRDALGLPTRESCCLVEPAATAEARRGSVWRYQLDVVDPASPDLKRVCATLEVKVDFHEGDLLFAAIEPGRGEKTDCGGRLTADGFVTAMSYRQESVDLARHHLKLAVE